MEQETSVKSQEKKVEELHWELQQWKSQFQFMQDETTFIGSLLDSYAFQPNTPNLFERLQDYKSDIAKITATKEELRKHISTHENELGGMLESTDVSRDLNYYREHDQLKAKIDTFFEGFKTLKSEIFNYTGSILKKQKP